MKTFLIILLLGALLIGWALLRLERGMIYHPTPLSGVDPAQFGLPCENVEIATADGERLQAWWCPRPEQDRPLLLFFHGNAGNREDRLHNLAGLWSAGFSVLIFDYRGYGGSSGTPSEKGLLADGIAAHDWLWNKRKKGEGRPLLFFGRSLGGAVAAGVAAAAAAEFPERQPAGLILESTFTSAPEMARRVLPIPGVEKVVRSKFDALAAVRALRLPLLVIHGTADELVPFEMGKRLFDEAGTARKELRAVAGGRHNDTYTVAGPEYYQWLREFAGSLGEP